MNIALLLQLREAGDRFVPLGELGARLDQVHSDLDALQEFGFAIERHPLLGAAYRGPAERLCPDQIEHALNTRRIGRRIAVWNRVSSTNDLAARASGSSSNDGLVVLAEEQSAGRGSRGRVWCAPAHSSLLMSILLFPPEILAGSAWLTALAAVATAEVVADWTRCAPRIKWPNDVRVDGRKIAGVLVERSAGAVIGIGLNANFRPSDFAPELQESATSVQILSGQPVDRSDLARSLISRLDHWYEQGRLHGPDSLSPAWRTFSEHLGQKVQVRTPSTELFGQLDDLDLTRGITLSAADHSETRIPLADVLSLASISVDSELTPPPEPPTANR